MDFGLQWHQRQLQETVRAFLSEKIDLEYLQACASGKPGFSRTVHEQMGKMGWLSIGTSPLEGDAVDAVDVAVLYEELGRAAAPGPHFISSLAASLLLQALGCGARPLAARLVSGESIATLAVYETEGDEDLGATATRAARRGDRWMLNGSKSYVPYADSADSILVLARDAGEPDRMSFFEVKPDQAGVRIEGFEVLSGERQCTVHLHHVAVDDGSLLRGRVSPSTALSRICPMLIVAQSAELVGLATTALDIAVAYAKDRIAFGHPIGSYQAIQHKCAEMLADVDAARFMVYQAACLVNAGELEDPRLHMTKAFAAAAARRVTKESHQILAGAGFVLDHPLNFFYRRVKGIEAAFGDVNFHLDRVADRLFEEPA